MKPRAGAWGFCVLLTAVTVLGVQGLSRAGPTPPTSLGVSPPPASVGPRVVRNGDRRSRKVALTFDACSTGSPSGYDAKIVEILQESRTPATFFLGGAWMLDHPEATRALAGFSLFELANHTMRHPHLPREPAERVRQELQGAQDVLFSLTGRLGRYYRPPYGEVDERVAALASSVGLTTVQFDVASGDPDRNFTKERLVAEVTGRVRGGSIVVMHVNGRGWHTAEALPEIIRRLRKKGFELTTVGRLLGDDAEKSGTPEGAAP